MIEHKSEERDGYLYIECHGTYEPGDFKRHDHILYEKLLTLRPERVLVNCLRVDGQITVLEKHFAAEELARRTGGAKVALLYGREKTDGHYENVATNRGATVKVFADEDKALAWLLE